MKKYLILFFLFLVFPFFVSAQTFDRDLYFGIQKDSDVTKLQEFLTEQNLYSGPISGNFFSLTLQAVKSFQSQQEVSPASGYFGPKTRGKANQILTAEGVNSTGVTDESGGTTPVVTIPPKTANDNDVVTSLTAQIQLLQQQLKALQQQSQTLQTIQQQQVSTTQQVAQQTQALQQTQQSVQQIQQNVQQIQQNTTTPLPPASTPPAPQVAKDLIVTTNKTSVSLVNWQQVTIKAVYTADGKWKPSDISFSAPDKSQTFYVKDNTYLCEGNPAQCGKVAFYYSPTIIGTHTISITANGLTKTVDIQVVPYVKVDSKIQNVVNLGTDGTNARTIGYFELSEADEIFKVESIKFDTDTKSELFYSNCGSLASFPSDSCVKSFGVYRIYINDSKNELKAGSHILTIKEIRLIGQSSGSYRYVSGLPVTFTFEVK